MSDHAVKKNGQCHDDCTACHVERLTAGLDRLDLAYARMWEDSELKIRRLQAVVAAVARCYDEWDDGAEYHRVKIPNELWEKLRARDGEPCSTCKGADRVGPGLAHVNCPDCHGTGRKP